MLALPCEDAPTDIAPTDSAPTLPLLKATFSGGCATGESASLRCTISSAFIVTPLILSTDSSYGKWSAPVAQLPFAAASYALPKRVRTKAATSSHASVAPSLPWLVATDPKLRSSEATSRRSSSYCSHCGTGLCRTHGRSSTTSLMRSPRRNGLDEAGQSSPASAALPIRSPRGDETPHTARNPLWSSGPSRPGQGPPGCPRLLPANRNVLALRDDVRPRLVDLARSRHAKARRR